MVEITIKMVKDGKEEVVAKKLRQHDCYLILSSLIDYKKTLDPNNLDFRDIEKMIPTFQTLGWFELIE